MRWQVKAGIALVVVSLLVPAPSCLLVWLAGVGMTGYGIGLGRPWPPREG